MKNNSSRKLLFTTIAIVVLTLLAGFVINLLTGREDVIKWQKDNNIETTYLLGAVIFIGLALIILTYFQIKYAENGEEKTLTENIEPDVKKLYDSLKERYQKRYESKLDERFEIKLEVSEDWDGRKTQTFKERYDKDAKISEAFPRLKELFDTKDGLLIVGEPGAGKTVLLLKVALNLLEKTNLADKEPFPVIFNLASWNKDYADFGEWLKAMLVSGNGLSKDFAERLLREKRFILLLDGLDELARNEEAEADQKRAACLESLNNYLDGEKTVICCRIDEFAAMQKNTAQDAPVSAKVEVLNLTEAELLNALEHARNHADTKHHASAKTVGELLAKDEIAALRQILCTPFYFTIALEVFYKRLPAETNLPKDEKELGTYLIEKYVERKLERTPNPNKFKVKRTRNWLKWLAQLMNRNEQVTFELADLQPRDMNFFLAFNVLFGITTFILFNLSITLFMIFAAINKPPVISESNAEFFAKFTSQDPVIVMTIIAFLIIYVLSFVFILPFCLLFGFRTLKINTEDSKRFSLKQLLHGSVWKDILITCLIYSPAICLLIYLLAIVTNSDPAESQRVIINAFLTVNLLIIIERILYHSRISIKVGNLRNPYQRLKGGLGFNLIKWAVAFTLTDFVGAIYMSGGWSPSVGLLIFMSIYVPLLSLINSAMLKHLILRFSLGITRTMPFRHVTFLNYAVKARILEKDGGQWRFRHQNLQEYFADLEVV